MDQVVCLGSSALGSANCSEPLAVGASAAGFPVKLGFPNYDVPLPGVRNPQRGPEARQRAMSSVASLAPSASERATYHASSAVRFSRSFQTRRAKGS